MNVYLSAAYHRKQEITGYAKRIAQETKHRIVSRWLVQRNQPDRKTSERVLQQRAKSDLRDERRCQILIRFSDPEFFGKKLVNPHLLSSARMVEFGVALERKMRCIIVGGKQAVFDRLPNVEHVATVDELILRLRKRHE